MDIIQKKIKLILLMIFTLFIFHDRGIISAELCSYRNYWVKNTGQVSPGIRYYSKIRDGRILITDNEIIFQFVSPENVNRIYEFTENDNNYLNDDCLIITSNVFLSFQGADFSNITAENPAETRLNYFTGSDSSKWHTDIPLYQRLRVKNIYPGVNLVFDGESTDHYFEFDADNPLYFDDKALIRYKDNSYSYTKIKNKVVNCIKTEADKKNINYIVWGTYIGGSLVDLPRSLSTDSDNNVIVTGFTNSTDIPVPNGYSSIYSGGWDIYTAKLCGESSQLLWGTYIGGTADDLAFSVNTDSNDCIIITGYTESHDIPVPGGYDTIFNGVRDNYVAKLSPQGNNLLWGTYIGGSNMDSCLDSAIFPNDDISIIGWTYSWDMPVPGGWDPYYNGDADIYIARLSSAGNSLLWGTYIGGSGNDQGRSITIDQSGNIVIAGYTNSPDMPVPNGYDTSFNGAWDIYTAKLTPYGNHMEWGTYIGGSGEDWGRRVATDSMDSVIVGGFTNSWDIPVPNGLNDYYRGGYDGYIVKLDSYGSILWGTYIGGSEDDYFYALGIDSLDNIISAISTRSSDISEGLINDSGTDMKIYAFKMPASGSQISWDTVISGSSDDYCLSLDRDIYDNIIIAGQTSSYDIPVPNGSNTSYSGNADIYAAKINPKATAFPDPWLSTHDISLERIQGEQGIKINTKVRNNGVRDVESGRLNFYFSPGSHPDYNYITHIDFGRIDPLGFINVSAEWYTYSLSLEEADQYTIILILSDIKPSDSNPGNNNASATIRLPIDLVLFSASSYGSSVSVLWATESEYLLTGYNIYRLIAEKISPFISYVPIRINSHLIPAYGDLEQSHSYKYTDFVENGRNYFYLLESVLEDSSVLRWKTRLKRLF